MAVLTDIDAGSGRVRIAHWCKVAGPLIPMGHSFNFNEAVMLFARNGCCGDAKAAGFQ
jgi:hypothetical protein